MPNCSAKGCNNTSKDGYALKCFPTNPERRAVWAANVKRANWTPTDNSRLCEVHFEADMWEKVREDGKKSLKWNAVPTLFFQKPPKRKKQSTSKQSSKNKDDSDTKVHFEESQFESHRADGLRKLKPNAVPTIFNIPLSYNHGKSKKKPVVDEEITTHEETHSELKTEETNDKKANSAVKGGKKSSKEKPELTYPKCVVQLEKLDDCIIWGETDEPTTEEVFINVSVAPENISSLTREKKRGRPPKKRKKDDRTNVTVSLTVPNRKRGRPSVSCKLNSSPPKKSMKTSIKSEPESNVHETEVEDDQNLKSGELENQQCFVCSKEVKEGISLCSLTNTTKIYMYQKLDRIVTGEMDLLIEEEGVLCSRCGNLLNYMDRIEVELSMLNKAILNCIRKKYGMGNRNDKAHEVLPVIEGDQNDGGNLINLNVVNSESIREASTENFEDDIEDCDQTENLNDIHDCDQTENNYDIQDCDQTKHIEEEEQGEFVSTPGEEIQCQLCKFKTSFRSIMIFHLRHHLKDLYQCDFCSVPLPDTSSSLVQKINRKHIVHLSANGNANGNDANETDINREEETVDSSIDQRTDSTGEVHFTGNSNENLENTSEVLLSIVPAETQIVIEEHDFSRPVQIKEVVHLAEYKNDKVSKGTVYEVNKSFPTSKIQKKQIRLLNESGKIVTAEIEIENEIVNSEATHSTTDVATFPHLSLQSVSADLQSRTESENEVSNTAETSGSVVKNKGYRIFNQIGMMIMPESENGGMFLTTDLDPSANEIRVNMTPELLTYSNTERKPNDVLEDKSGDTNESMFES